MKKLKRRVPFGLPVFCVLLFLPVLVCAAGQTGGKKIETAAPAAQTRDFGFSHMEIFKFKYATSHLDIRDMNSDKLDDILFLNNKDSRIEILLRKPATGSVQNGGFPRLNERFINRGFVLDQWTKTFLAADVNGDSRPDILSVGDQLGLAVRLQSANGSFGQPVTRRIKDANDLVNFSANDLNGDKHPDLLVSRRANAEIFWNNGSGQFNTQTMLNYSSSGCQGAIVADINNDKYPDLLFYFGSDRHSLRVRLGLGNGRFGWEQPLPLPAVRSLRRVDIPATPTSPGGSILAAILKNGIIARLYNFKTRMQESILGQMEATPRRLSITGIGNKDNPTWAAADFNRDNYTDFCIAAPQLSQVHLYMGGPNGLNPIPRAIDSLNAIKTMAVTAKGDIIVFSTVEKAVGLHPGGKLDSFPVFFKAPGKPVAAAVAQPTDLFAIFKDKTGQLQLHLFNTETPAAPPFRTISLKTLNVDNPPSDIRVFPIKKTKQWLVMLFMPYEPPVVFVLNREYGKTTLITPDRFRAMALNLSASTVTGIGDGNTPTLLICEGKVARIYQWQNNRLIVKRQLNPGRKAAQLTVACRFNPKGRKKAGYLVYDQPGRDLVWFDPHAKPRAIPRAVHFSGGLKGIIGIAPFQAGKKQGLLLVGKNEIQWLQEKQTELALNILGEYSSPGDKPSLWAAFPVKLGSPGKPMLALLDSNNRSIEFIGMNPDINPKSNKNSSSAQTQNSKHSKNHRGLKGELVFEVFQDPGFSETVESYEPHSLGSGDFNGDNIRDLAILVHDKLIIYIGE